MNQKMIEQLEHVLEQVTGRKMRVEKDSSFKHDLGVDSLSMVEVVLASEEAFGVTFDQSELIAENLERTDAFLGLVENKL